jgi:heme/copper-type cytochrome/quinol oxidase subunit 4
VLQPLTIVEYVLSALLSVLALHRMLRRRLIDDPVVITAAVLEAALVVQLVVGLAKSGAITDGAERATFIAYLFTALVVAPAAVFMAIKEKTQWAMGVVIGGALVVGVLVARLQQIWSLGA